MTTEPQSGEIDVGALLLSLWLGRWWILLFLVASLLAATFYVLNTPPSYRADALIQIEQRGSALALPEAVGRLADNETRTITEIEIIRSRLVLGQAVSSVNFDWLYAPQNLPFIGEFLISLSRHVPALAAYLNHLPGTEKLDLDLLQVPPAWLGKPLHLLAEGEDRFQVTTPDGVQHAGRVGEMLRVPAHSFALKLGELTALPGRRFVLAQRDELGSIMAMRGNLVITEEGRQSSILRLQYTARSRAEAERILGAITQAYVNQNIGRSAAEANNGLGFIRSQLPEAQARLQTAEEALNRYRRQQQSVDLSFETQALLTQIRVVEGDLAVLQTREDEIRTRYTSSHPVYQQLLIQRGRLRERLQAMQAEVASLPGTQREMMNLTREVEIAQTTYAQLLTRAQELGVMGASSVGNVRLIDVARAEAAPVAPRRSVILGAAAVLGPLAGCAFILLRNWLRSGIVSTAQIEQLGLPVFGVVGFSAKAQRAAARRDYRILAQSERDELTIEAFRSLRTSLHFGLPEGTNRAVAITSANPNAGKSFVSINLAFVAAEAGLRVCLIDADLRRGMLRRYFGLPAQHPGLSDYLAGTAALGAVRHATGIACLDLIATGRYPPNPSELLMRKAWPEALRELAKDCDLIIVDSPPALMLTDATLIADASDAVLFVVRHGVTHVAELQEAKRHFEQAGIRVTGSILNFFNPKVGGVQTYYQYKYYDYRSKSDGRA